MDSDAEAQREPKDIRLGKGQAKARRAQQLWARTIRSGCWVRLPERHCRSDRGDAGQHLGLYVGNGFSAGDQKAVFPVHPDCEGHGVHAQGDVPVPGVEVRLRGVVEFLRFGGCQDAISVRLSVGPKSP